MHSRLRPAIVCVDGDRGVGRCGSGKSSDLERVKWHLNVGGRCEEGIFWGNQYWKWLG